VPAKLRLLIITAFFPELFFCPSRTASSTAFRVRLNAHEFLAPIPLFPDYPSPDKCLRLWKAFYPLSGASTFGNVPTPPFLVSPCSIRAKVTPANHQKTKSSRFLRSSEAEALNTNDTTLYGPFWRQTLLLVPFLLQMPFGSMAGTLLSLRDAETFLSLLALFSERESPFAIYVSF